MRSLWMLLCVLLLVGCAGRADRGATDYAPASAEALAFDPPVTWGLPALALDREGRTPAAFYGYEELTTTWFYLRLDDRQTNQFEDHYLRQSITERLSVTYR